MEPPPNTALIPYRVCPWILRRKFNARRILQRLSAGTLTFRVTDQNPASPEVGQPPGTIKQHIEIFRPGRPSQIVARATRFVLHGELVASGRPDPTWLPDGPNALILAHRFDPECALCQAKRARALARPATRQPKEG